MTEEHVLWKPDQERLYVMECLDDPRFFLHDELLIRPVLYEEKPRIVCFTYCLNRGHAFQGDIEKMTNDILQIHCTEAGAHENHTFLIRPMNEDDFQRKRKEIERRDGWPHTHRELFDAYVEEAKWG